MKIISHRGNLDGRIPKMENNPFYIQAAIDNGYDVEIDVWYVDGKFYLGHDSPSYVVEPNWLLSKSSLWCHTKNIEAMEKLLSVKNVICFWHQTDKMTITNNGILWLYPGNYSSLGVSVELGLPNKIPNVWGICTDYPLLWTQL